MEIPMPETQEKILYTDRYDWKLDKEVRREIVEGTEAQFDTIRTKIKKLRSAGKDDQAKREIEKFVEQYMIDTSRMDWDSFKSELQAFDDTYHDYIILRDVGLWTGRQYGIPTRCETLLDCVQQITANFRGSYELTFRDIDSQFWVDLAHHDNTNHYHIVELVKNDSEFDDDYLYRLGHPETPVAKLRTFLRHHCCEIGFHNRFRDIPDLEWRECHPVFLEKQADFKVHAWRFARTDQPVSDTDLATSMAS
jgi:hypothetical protein